MVLVGGALLIYAGLQFVGTHSGTASHVAFLAAATFVLIMFGLIFVVTSPQADYLEVNSGGLSFRFTSGKSLTVGWKNPNLNLRMAATQGAADGISARQPIWAVVCGRRRQRTYVTQEAFEEVIRMGRLCGVRIESQPSPHPGWTRYGVTNGR